MTDQAQTPPGSGTGGTPPAAGGAQQQQQAQAPSRPEWLPESHWDGEKNSIKDDFGAHYTEVANFHKTETEKRAALAARKPEDIKFDPAALPKELHEAAQKAGLKLTIDEKDPRIPAIRQMAIENGWDDGVVTKLVALDAQQKLQARTAEMERIAAEDKKLGANVDTRKKAVADWIKGLTANGGFTAEESEELRITAATASGVTALEKLIAKTAGAVPAGTPKIEPKPEPAPLMERMFTKRLANSGGK